MQAGPIYLGIDTGGTYTDGVLLKPETGEVLKSVKVLTTHHDLRLCIAEVLDQLALDDPAGIAQVSLSTTLATNAIAEGKRKPVALLLLGYDPELVHRFEFHRQFGTPHYFFIPGRHDISGVEQEPLDEEELARVVRAIEDKVEAFAIVSYGPRNMRHEVRAAEVVAGLTTLPVVQGHHLSGELNSIWRATTASLNASLLTHVQDFLRAVQGMLAQRNIRCPVMMVKGDGSLVRADVAGQRPVEIIHSGPATSAAWTPARNWPPMALVAGPEWMISTGRWPATSARTREPSPFTIITGHRIFRWASMPCTARRKSCTCVSSEALRLAVVARQMEFSSPDRWCP